MLRLASNLVLFGMLGLSQPQAALGKAASGSANRQGRAMSAVSGSPSAPYTAIVSESSGTFSFPMPAARRFEWCPGGLQYGYEVRTAQHQFGFTLFTAMGAAPCGEGGLQDMLNAGQTDAFELQGDGGGVAVPGSDRSISIRPDAQRRLLVVSVTGASVVRQLFRSHPATVEFTMTTPRGEEKHRVRVQYVR